jgi:hypothetical protein
MQTVKLGTHYMKHLQLATIRYVTQVSKVMAAALLSDLFEFEQAREEESQAEQVYRQASDAFLSHRKDHGC